MAIITCSPSAPMPIICSRSCGMLLLCGALWAAGCRSPPPAHLLHPQLPIRQHQGQELVVSPLGQHQGQLGFHGAGCVGCTPQPCVGWLETVELSDETLVAKFSTGSTGDVIYPVQPTFGSTVKMVIIFADLQSHGPNVLKFLPRACMQTSNHKPCMSQKQHTMSPFPVSWHFGSSTAKVWR